MKYAIIMILAMLATDPLRISRINTAKSEAKDAFQSGDYQTAISKYTYLIDSLGVAEDELALNRAHALYLLKDTANAFTQYQSLMQSVKKEIVSKAGNQLGLMTNLRGKSEEALQYFKQAIKANPGNEEARYNYEMLKKKLDKKKKDDQQKQDDKNKKEPSAFAKKLKAQADRLVIEKRYGEAYDLMINGLKQDETVSYYEDYIKRTKDVADINK